MSGIAPKRLVAFAVILGVWGISVGFRLAQIQIVRGPAYRSRARQQQERTVRLSPRRGSIYDRANRELAVSVEAFSIFAVPDKVLDPSGEARSLAEILGVPAREILPKLKADRAFSWIARKVDDSAAARVRESRLPGVNLLPEVRRYYPNESLAANVLGYVGLDGEGLGGIEFEYDHSIRGLEGEMRVSRDARQDGYALTPIPGREGKQGSAIVLTLDRDLQFVAEQELARAIAATGAHDGSVVAMDPRTGNVLAMASFPTFDPNHYSQFSPADWRNLPIANSYEPGSVFKVITGSAMLESGVAAPEDPVDCGEGTIQVGNYVIHDAEHERFGIIPFSQVIAKSSNVGMVRLGLRLGAQRLYSAVRAFGIGEPTGIDLPGENVGILRQVSQWSLLSNASISYGQEVSVTPIQLGVAMSVVANGGYRIRPRIRARTIDPDGHESDAPQAPPERILSPSTVSAMNQILRGVVVEGTGKRAAAEGYLVAGKTGTAQKAIGHGYSRDKFVATFAGFAPADDPRVVLVVTIDEPRGQYFASEVAAPVFGRILSQMLPMLGIPPSGSVVPAPASPAMEIAQRKPVFASGVETASLSRAIGAEGEDRMPDVRGLPARAAIAELSRRGVDVRMIGSGFVVAQSPESGSPIGPGGSCRLRLSGSPSP
ncbi:MAG: penicillin-binding protein [Thermoanaerobaculia bacterium]